MGARLPTGRDWSESSTLLLEDVTGVEQPALIVGIAVERTVDKWPWSVGSTAEVGVGNGVQPSIITSGSVGRYITPR